ncbi:hypothetical protein DL770_001634 [Monosporascus sp. CRB-9-2]|nr:hypothetical protein DL770_001634 [Monosporascus sp. CRB-9-2]
MRVNSIIVSALALMPSAFAITCLPDITTTVTDNITTTVTETATTSASTGAHEIQADVRTRLIDGHGAVPTPDVQLQDADLHDAEPSAHRLHASCHYHLSSPQGSSPRACCETCHFGVESCVQAYWSPYQGCVVSQATNAAADTGHHVTCSCPVGTFEGLIYGPDVRPAFRSTGNIAGPCGQSYTNF